MRMIPATALCLVLAACAGQAGPGTPPLADAQGSCSHDGLDAFTGKQATAETGAALLKASGAKTLRWGGPGTAMTMDFRPDRLTVSYDETMLITAARCG